MKRITICIVTLILGISITASIKAEPKVKIQESSFDFGYAPQGSKLSHKYWIHSTGSEDLKITKVVPGCGCTKAPLEKDIITSGDSTWLEIIFSTRKYKNKITKKPKFFTNAGEDAQRISFTTQVVSPTDTTYPLEIKPFKVNLSNPTDMHLVNSSSLDEKDNEQGSFKIHNSSDEELTISIVDYDFKNFDITIPAIIKAGETADGKILLLSNKADKSFYKSVTIEVNDENKTRFTIPVVYETNIISNK